jgi:hypothetical protein
MFRGHLVAGNHVDGADQRSIAADQRSIIIILLPEEIECDNFFRAERHTLFGYNQREVR